MKHWQRIIQLIGIATTILCVWGLYLLIQGYRQQLAHPFVDSRAPFFKVVFLVMNVVALSLLIAMAVAALRLLNPTHTAVVFYTSMYFCLILYAFVPGLLWLISGPIGTSIAAASGVSNVGLGPLVFAPIPFVYPVLSIVLVNLAERRILSNRENIVGC